METKEKVQIDWKVVFKLGIILFVISAVAACALALTNYVTAGTIEQMNIESNKVARQEVLEAKDFEQVSAEDVAKIAEEIGMEKPEELLEVYIGTNNGEVVGYTVKTGPTSGYSGEVQVLTGITSDGIISGITIIKHNETPGLGALATGEWNDQFNGKSATEELVVVKGAAKEGSNEIQAITGSTITSKAVIEGVNTSIAVYQNMSK